MVESGMQADHVPASGFRDRSAGFDPLSDVLELVHLEGALLFMVDASDPWCVDVPPVAAYAEILGAPRGRVISFHIVLEGAGLASVPGSNPTRFQPGDVLVYPKGDAYRMESALGTPPEFDRDGMIAFFAALAAERLPFVVPEGGGGTPTARFVCGFLTADAPLFDPLLSNLPALLKVGRPNPESDTLSGLVDAAGAAFARDGPGLRTVRRSICRLMLVETLRQHLMNVGAQEAGWLAALADPVAGAAIRILHERPSEGWTLALLARQVGTSRSVLSERFTRKVGRSPMDYLAFWRVQLAGDMLMRDRVSIEEAAAQVGYASAQSFSRAFKRVAGVSPAVWRRDAGTPPAARRDGSS